LHDAPAASIGRVDARGIHHLGVAVVDLDEAVETYRRLFGATVERRAEVPAQGVEAAAVRVGDSRIELVAPLDGDTPVGRFLAKRGPGMHHIAFEVDDIRIALDELRTDGANLVDDVPHRGLFGLEVAFVHPESVHGVLAEVVSNG
jgi:methylmalonyl-CoA/ethylmalonyl-CoA epimerase